MQIEKNVILCSILALSIGIAAIAPLSLFMQSARAQTTDDTPWFNVDIPYAYYKATSENEMRTFSNEEVEVITCATEHYIGLNYTLNPQAEDKLENARSEIYRIHIYSDLGSIQNVTVYFGANCNNEFDPSTNFRFSQDDLFNITTTGSGTLLTEFGATSDALADGSICSNGGSSKTSYFANTTLPEAFLNTQNVQTIYIDVYRFGYVTFENNSTTVTLAENNTAIEHVELTKNGDIFTYGDVPENMLNTVNVEPDPFAERNTTDNNAVHIEINENGEITNKDGKDGIYPVPVS
jgi:hypothetical protein